MSAGAPLRRDVFCSHCIEPVVLDADVVEDDDGINLQILGREVRWTCPHCGASERTWFDADVARVRASKGEASPPSVI
jgi:hypothetical protein